MLLTFVSVATVLPVLSAAVANRQIGWGEDRTLPSDEFYKRYVVSSVASGGQDVLSAGLPLVRLPTFILANILDWFQSKDASNIFVPVALFCTLWILLKGVRYLAPSQVSRVEASVARAVTRPVLPVVPVAVFVGILGSWQLSLLLRAATSAGAKATDSSWKGVFKPFPFGREQVTKVRAVGDMINSLILSPLASTVAPWAYDSELARDSFAWHLSFTYLRTFVAGTLLCEELL